MDHMEYVLASLEMFESITENLIAYTFNIVSYDMNTTMWVLLLASMPPRVPHADKHLFELDWKPKNRRTLTVATVIFFPLTFLTGYFGMNFNGMLSVQAHTEAFFWTLAIPVMVGSFQTTFPFYASPTDGRETHLCRDCIGCYGAGLQRLQHHEFLPLDKEEDASEADWMYVF